VKKDPKKEGSTAGGGAMEDLQNAKQRPSGQHWDNCEEASSRRANKRLHKMMGSVLEEMNGR
jgi:hypothetical protein